MGVCLLILEVLVTTVSLDDLSSCNSHGLGGLTPILATALRPLFSKSGTRRVGPTKRMLAPLTSSLPCSSPGMEGQEPPETRGLEHRLHTAIGYDCRDTPSSTPSAQLIESVMLKLLRNPVPRSRCSHPNAGTTAHGRKTGSDSCPVHYFGVTRGQGGGGSSTNSKKCSKPWERLRLRMRERDVE